MTRNPKTTLLARLAALLLLAGGLFACSGSDDNEETLTVLAWNVWHAGHAEAYGQKACDAVVGILRRSGADVVLMVETYDAAPRIAEALGYDYHLISSNLCIFSRYPIRRTFDFSDAIGTFNFGGAEIDFDGTPVRVFDTWLHYLPDARLAPTHLPEAEILAWDDAGSRDDEIRTIIDVLKPLTAQADSIPVVVGGDFNSHSHLDWTDATRNLYNHGGAVVG